MSREFLFAADANARDVKSSTRVIKKARPPMGGTSGGLALPDKGRGTWGMMGVAPYPVALI